MNYKLYRIERALLRENPELAHYRYDIVNTLTGGCVLTAFTTHTLPPRKLVHRCNQLNNTWMYTGQQGVLT